MLILFKIRQGFNLEILCLMLEKFESFKVNFVNLKKNQELLLKIYFIHGLWFFRVFRHFQPGLMNSFSCFMVSKHFLTVFIFKNDKFNNSLVKS